MKKKKNEEANEEIKEEEKKEVPKPTEASKMNDEQMNAILLELANSYHWQAILRYNFVRCLITDGSFRSLDPFKNPTEMARNQGIYVGLKDLENYVNELKERAESVDNSNS